LYAQVGSEKLFYTVIPSNPGQTNESEIYIQPELVQDGYLITGDIDKLWENRRSPSHPGKNVAVLMTVGQQENDFFTMGALISNYAKIVEEERLCSEVPSPHSVLEQLGYDLETIQNIRENDKAPFFPLFRSAINRITHQRYNEIAFKYNDTNPNFTAKVHCYELAVNEEIFKGALEQSICTFESNVNDVSENIKSKHVQTVRKVGRKILESEKLLEHCATHVFDYVVVLGAEFTIFPCTGKIEPAIRFEKILSSENLKSILEPIYQFLNDEECQISPTPEPDSSLGTSQELITVNTHVLRKMIRDFYSSLAL